MAEDKKLRDSINSIPEFIKLIKEKFSPSTPPIVPTAPVIPTELLKVKTSDGVELSITKMEVGATVSDATGQPTPSQKYTLEDGSIVETDADSKIVSIMPGKPKAAEEMGANGAVPTPSQVTKQLGELENGISSITIKYSELEADHKKTISDFEKRLKEANDRQKKTDEIVSDMFKLVEKIADEPQEKSKFSKKDGVKVEKSAETDLEAWRKAYLKN